MELPGGHLEDPPRFRIDDPVEEYFIDRADKHGIIDSAFEETEEYDG
jgi:hypothetical protein